LGLDVTSFRIFFCSKVANEFWAEFLPRATIACTSGIDRAKKEGHMRSLSLARGSQVIRRGKPRKGYVWTPRCAWFVQVHKKFNKPGWNSWISPTLNTHTQTLKDSPEPKVLGACH
jgi:hypothetical protein